jgi:chorismate synthase
MASNSFGQLLKFTTWGESHGQAIGVVIDGMPARVPLSAELIQPYLDKRKPGTSKFVTQRRESDAVEILSGVFEGQTTGHPISLMIKNEDARSKDYEDIKEQWRPGHADYTYDIKYGIRDHRGSGRASARETASRVAAGAVARQLIPGITIRGAVVQLGPHAIDRTRCDWAQVEQNPFWCPDAQMAAQWEEYLDGVRKAGSSCGAIIEVVASGVPAGLGEPIYGKLESEIAHAIMGINAVKAVEIGSGFALAAMPGHEAGDEMSLGADGKPAFGSNHNGGILGGISTGQDIVVRFAVKPTSSILTPRASLDKSGNAVEVVTKGRHDPCVGIRAVPVGEAMLAFVLADQLLRARALGQMIERL